MKASEARALMSDAKAKLAEKEEQEYSNIIRDIQKAASEGKDTVSFDSMSSSVKHKLELNDYIVSYSSWRNESLYTVKW